MADVPFIDALQKRHAKQVGWMPTKQLEGKIAGGQVIVAEEAGTSVGYCIGHDQYFKHDDVGIIYQVNVVPGRQRGFVGATLLKAQFERSAWGCKLYCCWCAQDLEANRFWESMGFVPLAFRAGSRDKDRVHIFWQKRIRAGDVTTPYWFPSQTTGGSIREDRLVFPIPPGVRWNDAMPRVLPAEKLLVASGQLPVKKGKTTPVPVPPMPKRRRVQFGPPPKILPPPPPPAPPVERQKAERKPKLKNDPMLVAKARELRDKWLEHVQANPAALLATGKYDVSRALAAATVPALPALVAA